ncbi:hypothetical protein N656DRAFT_774777 [Canariomyces notabilis]|uniref:Uncharacterized protein n=1 Tax=Canariomyces notabilis TaxID=2074819 RepID=A0AAN6TM54_9PEZI|nr:hypothetical protein N656DRAFT_774777 [Canariomyces arenarius]
MCFDQPVEKYYYHEEIVPARRHHHHPHHHHHHHSSRSSYSSHAPRAHYSPSPRASVTSYRSSNPVVYEYDRTVKTRY